MYMMNPNFKIGLSGRHVVANLERAQNEINAYIKKGHNAAFDMLSEFSRHGNTYAINLDAAIDSVTDEDVTFARIIPSCNANLKNGVAYIDTKKKVHSITELEKKSIEVAKKMVEALRVGMHVLVAFLVKLDVLCEKILTKGNAYIQTAYLQRAAYHKMCIEQEKQRSMEMEPVYVSTTLVSSTSHNDVVHAIPTTSEVPRTHDVERKDVVRRGRRSTFFYALTLLYGELRYGKRYINKIDSI